MTQLKHFLSLADIPSSELRAILDEAHRRKRARSGFPKGRLDADAPMSGETLAMIFEKSSTRTRFSFDMAMRQLGGSSITATSNDMQLGRGETVEDTAKVLSRFVDAIMLRANAHETLVNLARNASVPVINGLTDYNHPCQIMADLQTLEENGGDLSDMTLTWVGDGNNVAVSFVNAAAKFGYTLRLSCPKGYTVPGQTVEAARQSGAKVETITDPLDACKSADVVIADTWVSMGDTDADKRMADLEDYQVTDALMNAARPAATFLHCLPAHRGEEVTASVIDGPQSRVLTRRKTAFTHRKRLSLGVLIRIDMTKNSDKDRRNAERRTGAKFRTAEEDRVAMQEMPQTPQTVHPAYRLAFDDDDFMTREELRPVRLQLELLKPQMLLDEAG